MPKDTPELRSLLQSIFQNPRFTIETVAKESGQRVVYFGYFEDVDPSELITPNKRLISLVDIGAVVMKVSQSSSPKALAYLKKEVEILGKLDSERFPTLYYDRVVKVDPRNLEELDDLVFITVEEKVVAPPLSECMGDYDTEAKIIDLLIGLVGALRVMWEHPSRLVHRDLKPDNLLVHQNGNITVIDLGIVREEGVDGLTNSFIPHGPCSFLYASPEQVRNQKRLINFRSDFFSLGVLAYELASGCNPIGKEGDYVDDVVEKICHEDFRPLHEISNVSTEFSEIVRRLTEKQPYMRYRRVEDFSEALQKLKNNNI